MGDLYVTVEENNKVIGEATIYCNKSLEDEVLNKEVIYRGANSRTENLRTRIQGITSEGIYIINDPVPIELDNVSLLNYKDFFADYTYADGREIGEFLHSKSTEIKSSGVKNKESYKNPLGLKPLLLHNKDRMSDILDAINRFARDNKKIPIEWAMEYNSYIIK